MAARKKKTATSRAIVPVPGISDAPRAIVEAGEQLYVRMPIGPAGIAIVKERMGAIGELFGAASELMSIMSDADDKLVKLVQTATSIAGLLSGDVAKAKQAVTRKRGRRR